MDGGGDYMDSSQPFIQNLHNYLHSDEWFKPLFEKLERKTGVKREYILLGLAFAIIVNLILGLGGELCCLIIGVAYPAIESVRVIESKKKEESIRLLKYWVVFCCYNVFEFLTYFILSWIPLYWLMKALFLCWCFAPIKVNGSAILFAILLKHLKTELGLIRPAAEADQGPSEPEPVAAAAEREFDLRPRKKSTSAAK